MPDTCAPKPSLADRLVRPGRGNLPQGDRFRRRRPAWVSASRSTVAPYAPPKRRALDGMAQTKFDRQLEETAEAVMFGIGRFLAGRDMEGVKRTDATSGHPCPYRRRRAASRVRSSTGRPPSTPSRRAGSAWPPPRSSVTGVRVADPGAPRADARVGGTAAPGPRTAPSHRGADRPAPLPARAEELQRRRRVDLTVHLQFSGNLVADLITRKLGPGERDVLQASAGRTPYVVVKKTCRPPKKAAFKDPKLGAGDQSARARTGHWHRHQRQDRLRRPGRRPALSRRAARTPGVSTSCGAT